MLLRGAEGNELGIALADYEFPESLGDARAASNAAYVTVPPRRYEPSGWRSWATWPRTRKSGMSISVLMVNGSVHDTAMDKRQLQQA